MIGKIQLPYRDLARLSLLPLGHTASGHKLIAGIKKCFRISPPPPVNGVGGGYALD